MSRIAKIAKSSAIGKSPVISANAIWRSLCPIDAASVPTAFAGKATSITTRLSEHITSAGAKERTILATMQKKGPGLATLGDASGINSTMFKTLAEIRGLALCIGAVKVKPSAKPVSTVPTRISKIGLLSTTGPTRGVKNKPIGIPLVYDSIDLGELAEAVVIARPPPSDVESISDSPEEAIAGVC